MLPASALILAIALGAGSSTSGPGIRTVPFITSQGTPPVYSENQHWGGFDAPTDRSITFTQIMWIQQSPSLLGGTLVFELRHSNGTLLCSGSTTCNVAADTDVRASCSATLQAGEHANLMVGTSSTCTTLPGGRITLSGQYGIP